MTKHLTEPGVAARQKSDRASTRARALRKHMTRAEKTLWRELRQFPIAGSHWRKQAPLGPFIVDFVCHGANVIVELDGGVHRVTEVARRDAERQAWLEGRGYRVLRFTNAEVETNVGAVVRAALAAAEGTPPPPCGEGEGRG